MRADQLFVSVIYDFEYMSEDGNRIFMKENEIFELYIEMIEKNFKQSHKKFKNL